MAFKMRIISSSSLVGEDLVHKVFGESHYPPLVLCLVVPFLIPTVIALISLLLQLKSLLYSSSSTERDPVKVRAAVTIFLLTLIFSICNTSSVAHWMRVCLDIEDNYLDEKNAVWVYVTGVTIPVLNSVLAPTVLIWRGNSLKERVLDLLMRREEGGRVVNNTLSTVVATRNNYKIDAIQMKEITSR